jgi:hypothetical protein
METITKQVILERKFEDDFFYIPEYTPNAHLLMNDIFSLPENRRDFWMRINRIYELSRIAITSKSKNSSVLYGNPFIGEVGSKNWYLTPDQLIDGIEKYIPHLLLDFEWKLFDKIKRYKYEGRKIRGIQELMYCVSEFSGSLLYMGPQGFIEKHNRANPYWNWTFDEVSNDVDFFTQ